MKRLTTLLLGLALIAGTIVAPAAAHPDNDGDGKPVPSSLGLLPSGPTPCDAGFAGIYPCDGVDLMAFLPHSSMGGGQGNDLWGWTDSETGREYALVGRTTGTSVVDVTDATAPEYVGQLAPHGASSIWRDIKVYADHAYIVSEAPGHGMQVFDLTQLRDHSGGPEVFSETAHYDGFGNAHNIIINEDTARAYAVGTSTCAGGLHIVDLGTPTSPSFGGCFSADGYTHDAQCVLYDGPDSDHVGDELCFAANEDTLTIVDVTNGSAPTQVSRTSYVGVGYAHQVWLTDDHRYLLADDEFDEFLNGHGTRTYIWDVRNVDNPTAIGSYTSPVGAIDHNQYILGSRSYQANYRAGLRILDVSDAPLGTLTETGYFDIWPQDDTAEFNAAWTAYPFFPSGTIALAGIDQGLYLLRADDRGPTAHVGDLGRKRWWREDGRWVSRVRIKVHDGAEQPVAGATVSGVWASGKTDTCVTNAGGKCKVKVSNKASVTIARFTVTDIALPGTVYEPKVNHDPDPSPKSDGTTIKMKPPPL